MNKKRSVFRKYVAILAFAVLAIVFKPEAGQDFPCVKLVQAVNVDSYYRLVDFRY